MSSENCHDLIIVGAGISGLGFAHLALQKGIKPLVLEATNHQGGCIDTYQFETPDGDGWVELGAHTCFNSYGTLLDMLEVQGMASDLQAKEKLSYQLLTQDGLTSIPRALNFLQILRSFVKFFSLNKSECTVEQYFGAIVGPDNFKRVVGPALDAVICQPSALFPADALFRKKPRKKEVERSYTGRRGLQVFVDAIAKQKDLDIRLSSPVKSLQRCEQGFRLILAGGEVFTAKQVALAVAPDVAAILLETMAPEICRLVSEIEMAEIDSMAVVVKAQQIPLEKMAGIIAQSDQFYSAVSRDPVSDPEFRAFTFHFHPDLLDESQRLQRACAVLGITSDQIIAVQSKRNRLPKLRIGHSGRISRLDALLDGDALAVTGNWFDGVSIEDSLLRTASEAKRLLSGLND